jgi:hypothetical protein
MAVTAEKLAAIYLERLAGVEKNIDESLLAQAYGDPTRLFYKIQVNACDKAEMLALSERYHAAGWNSIHLVTDKISGDYYKFVPSTKMRETLTQLTLGKPGSIVTDDEAVRPLKV